MPFLILKTYINIIVVKKTNMFKIVLKPVQENKIAVTEKRLYRITKV
jgi:hypothetical protein